MKNIFTLLLLPVCFSLFGQLDTMIVYDLTTKTYEVIPPVEYDATITNDKTNSSMGTMEGFTELSNEIPADNLFENADFTKLVKSADLFDMSHYPMRTAVKLKGITSSSGESECSGTLVSDNLVLTASHCTFDFFGNIEFFVESMDVLPSYDNGEVPENIPTAKVTKVFLTKKTFDGEGLFDVSLLLLDEPIGETLGYKGFGFAPVDELMDKVLHLMSYPAANSNTDPIEYYNGDTTYYNYGLIDYEPFFGWLEIDSPEAQGIPGQSGSGLFESLEEEQTVYGVLTMNNYQHYQLLPRYFYQMKNIVDNFEIVSSLAPVEIRTQITLSPNPFHDKTTVVFSENISGLHQYKLVDLRGQIVQEGKFYNNNLSISRNNLANGIYILSIIMENGVSLQRQIVAM